MWSNSDRLSCSNAVQAVQTQRNNNCFDVEGKVAVVRNVIQLLSGEMYTVCQFYEKQDCFCKYTIDSCCLGIRTATQLSEQHCGIPVTSLTKKLILLPLQDIHVVFPQLHDNTTKVCHGRSSIGSSNNQLLYPRKAT